jgi:hypothetical protein
MMPSLERALWVAYGRALEADCYDTARDLMDAIMALHQRRMLLEPPVVVTPHGPFGGEPHALREAGGAGRHSEPRSAPRGKGGTRCAFPPYDA